jgi:soluble lytic murein transglycosylase-like protein
MTPTTTAGLIAHYGDKWSVDERLMLRIAQAESGLDPGAKNPTSSASGVYQWIASSWKSICQPLGFEDVFNASENIECAAMTIKNGGISHWDASRFAWQ